jgi:hypothetical protein
MQFNHFYFLKSHNNYLIKFVSATNSAYILQLLKILMTIENLTSRYSLLNFEKLLMTINDIQILFI